MGLMGRRYWRGSLKAGLALFLSVALLTTAAAGALAQAQTFKIMESNFKIEGAPATVVAGATLTFNDTASGFPHNLAIDGNGVDIKSGDPNLRDATGVITLQAPTQPGTYTLYCPVGNHRAQGMSVPITVVAGAVALPRTGSAGPLPSRGFPLLPIGLATAGLASGVGAFFLRRH